MPSNRGYGTVTPRVNFWINGSRPNHSQPKKKSKDFREGGHWHNVVVDPTSPEYGERLDYQTIRPIENYTALHGFCDSTGTLNPDLPRSQCNVTVSEKSSRTIVQSLIFYRSAEALQQVIDVGVKEGLISTLERLDELLAKLNCEMFARGTIQHSLAYHAPKLANYQPKLEGDSTQSHKE